MRWLGIDAGGTKTAFATYDETLTQLDRFELPTSHYAQAGFNGMEAVLAEGIARAEAAGLLSEQYGIGIGMCGYGEGTTSTARIEQIVAKVAGAHPYALVNDVESAWAAGLNLADGIVIIAGTGSIAYGVHGERSLRCGGWDYELGDEGSGGWLGKELLRAFPPVRRTRPGGASAQPRATGARACRRFRYHRLRAGTHGEPLAHLGPCAPGEQSRSGGRRKRPAHP